MNGRLWCRLVSRRERTTLDPGVHYAAVLGYRSTGHDTCDSFQYDGLRHFLYQSTTPFLSWFQLTDRIHKHKFVFGAKPIKKGCEPHLDYDIGDSRNTVLTPCPSGLALVNAREEILDGFVKLGRRW